LDDIKDWPEVTSSNTLSATADELYRNARSYSAAYGQITDNQLAYLQSEIIRDETQGIDNQFDSWLHYEKSLGPRYAEFMKSMPAVQDKRMDIYDDEDLVHYFDLLSSTTLQNTNAAEDLKIRGSFCSPRIPTEGMKMMEVSFTVDLTTHYKISTQGIEDGSYLPWEPRETFWVYDAPAEGLTHFFVFKKPSVSKLSNYYKISTALDATVYGMEYSESFFARRPENGSCDTATASPTKAPIAPTAPPTSAPTVSPTVAPTISPTTPAITESPTKTSIAPTAPPTNAPTASPTVAPTVAPTISPTTTATISPSSKPSSSPTTATGDGNGCCSQNFRTCASYGGDSKESCESMGSMIWLENGDLSQQCLEQYNACTDDINACCPGLTCDGSQWYKQCILK